jgi:hypothetical protein
VLCRDCGGPFSEHAPLPAFICQFCLAADYGQLTGASHEPMVRARLRALVRGRMHLLTTIKRSSSARQSAQGRQRLKAHGDSLGIDLIPTSPQFLMDYAVSALSGAKPLDSSTIKLYMLSVGDVYEYCRVTLRMGGVRNPLRDAQLVAILRTLGINFKKAGGGAMALTVAELHGLYHNGFVGRTRRARWARLFFLGLNFGMLRNTAMWGVTVSYTVDSDGTVTFLADSKIKYYYHEQFGAFVFDIIIDDDKNMNALKAAQDGGRHAYIPGLLPHLHIDVAAVVFDWLRTERPPSGGCLFAYPNKKGHGFSATPTTTFNATLRAAYKLAFPSANPEYIRMLSSHSGRKTLAQLLWDAGFNRRLIADAGGWFIKREAMDLYFKTAPYVILNAIASLRLDGSSSMLQTTATANAARQE